MTTKLFPSGEDTGTLIRLRVGDLGHVPAAAGHTPRRRPEPAERSTVRKAFECAYPYLDANGVERFQHVRYRILHPEDANGRTKTFRYRWRQRPDYVWVKRFPSEWANLIYRLPAVMDEADGDTVWICEGEKDADRLASLGLVATTHHRCGPFLPGNARWIAEAGARDVAVCMDNDPPGALYALDTYRALRKVGFEHTQIRIVKAADGLKDVSDHLDAGHSPDELVKVRAVDVQAIARTVTTRDVTARGYLAPSIGA